MPTKTEKVSGIAKFRQHQQLRYFLIDWVWALLGTGDAKQIDCWMWALVGTRRLYWRNNISPRIIFLSHNRRKLQRVLLFPGTVTQENSWVKIRVILEKWVRVGPVVRGTGRRR